MVRAIADPRRGVAALAGRPLLMINGKYDRSVTPKQAESLFAAAAEPKTIRWYNAGHWPPPSEIGYAASWLTTTLVTAHSRRSA
jgi:fermentation-respiration switch protein FrsA (DUF1100 family)